MVEVTRLKPFDKAIDSRKENWLVLEAFIHFLIAVGRIETDKEIDSKAKTFRIGRFLNTVPKIFRRQKRSQYPYPYFADLIFNPTEKVWRSI